MDAHDFVATSLRREISSAGDTAPDDLRRFLDALRQALIREGCAMIGHIKGLVEDGVSPALFFSVTSFTGDAQVKGGPLEEDSLTMQITVIVAGMDERKVAEVLEGTLSEHYGARP